MSTAVRTSYLTNKIEFQGALKREAAGSFTVE
jgi:hypothetical protein